MLQMQKENMSNYLLPTDEQFIEKVAKSIARDRLRRDASATIEKMIGVNVDISMQVEATFDRLFDKLWNNNGPADITQKNGYREDAHAAINTINLLLITAPE